MQRTGFPSALGATRLRAGLALALIALQLVPGVLGAGVPGPVVPVPAPNDLTIEHGTAWDAFVLHWEPSLPPALIEAHRILRDGRPVGTAGPDATTFEERTGLRGTHCYTVTTLAVAGEESAPAGPVCLATPAVPDAPTAPALTDDGRHLVLSWSAPDDQHPAPDRYRVYRASGSTGAFILYVERAVTDPTFTDGQIECGRVFYYQVTGTNEVGEGPPSIAVGASAPGCPPEPITTATAGPDAQEITVSWSVPDGATIDSFTVYRNRAAVATPGPEARSYTGTGLGEGTTSCFIVTATNAAGEHPAPFAPYATEACASTFEPPGAVSDLRANPAGLEGTVLVEWTAPAADGGTPITTYRVYRLSPTSGAYDHIASVAGNERSFLDVSSELPVACYEVRAVNLAGEGPPPATSAAACSPFGSAGAPGSLARLRPGSSDAANA